MSAKKYTGISKLEQYLFNYLMEKKSDKTLGGLSCVEEHKLNKLTIKALKTIGNDTFAQWAIDDATYDFLQKRGLVTGAGSDSRGDSYIKTSPAGQDYLSRYNNKTYPF